MHTGADHHRRPAQAQEQRRVRVRYMPVAVRPSAVRHCARPRGQYRGERERGPQGIPR